MVLSFKKRTLGLFNFDKNKGERVFGIGRMHPYEVSQVCLIDNTIEEVVIENFKRKLNIFKLLVEDLFFFISGDMVTIKGRVRNQSDKEKIILILGNSYGISIVEDQIVVEDVEIESQFYSVVKGDSLGKIAKVYYGCPKMYYEIFEANKPMLSHPNNIYPGQVLRIPILNSN